MAGGGVTGINFFAGLIPNLLNLGFIIGAIIFIVMLVIGAFQWITAGSDKVALESAKSRIVNAIIGLIILLSFFVIIAAVQIIFGFQILNLDLRLLLLNTTVPYTGPP